MAKDTIQRAKDQKRGKKISVTHMPKTSIYRQKLLQASKKATQVLGKQHYYFQNHNVMLLFQIKKKNIFFFFFTLKEHKKTQRSGLDRCFPGF